MVDQGSTRLLSLGHQDRQGAGTNCSLSYSNIVRVNLHFLSPLYSTRNDASIFGSDRYHPMGTVKMGPLEKGGVVDGFLRVHGIPNLRVVDASVFPTAASGHTVSYFRLIRYRVQGLLIPLPFRPLLLLLSRNMPRSLSLKIFALVHSVPVAPQSLLPTFLNPVHPVTTCCKITPLMPRLFSVQRESM